MLEPKSLFIERMRKLLPDNEDYEKYRKYADMKIQNSIRVNTIKISPEKLKEKLELKEWKISQPYKSNPEIMIVEKESNLEPGELGKSQEHILGYYYVQEVSSMMPIIALNPQPNELILDIAASPGSKTTQASSLMKNTGTIIANDKSLDRTNILSANLQRCSCSNVLITRHDGVRLCEKLKKLGLKFDKILLDLPCSGEGNTRSNSKTYLMWNIKMIRNLSRLQRALAASAVSLLKEGGELVYSTCTHSPEENEENINFLLNNFPLKIIPSNIPLKSRQGITEWNNKKLNSEIKHAHRIYPQDNNTEGFFLCKMRKTGE